MTSRCTEEELRALLAADNNIDYIVICNDIVYDITRFVNEIPIEISADPTDFEAVYNSFPDPLTERGEIYYSFLTQLSINNGGPNISDLKTALIAFSSIKLDIFDYYLINIIDCKTVRTLEYWQNIVNGPC